jgi:hypothetical protein
MKAAGVTMEKSKTRKLIKFIQCLETSFLVMNGAKSRKEGRK